MVFFLPFIARKYCTLVCSISHLKLLLDGRRLFVTCHFWVIYMMLTRSMGVKVSAYRHKSPVRFFFFLLFISSNYCRSTRYLLYSTHVGSEDKSH